MPTGRGLASKPLIISNQYAQEYEPEQKDPVIVPAAVVSPATNPNTTPTSQVTNTYQRLQASPPPPQTQPYVPPGKDAFAIH